MNYTPSFFTSYVGVFIVLAVGIYCTYLFYYSTKNEFTTRMKLLIGAIGCFLYFIIVILMKILDKI